jgi:hypothetical protein
MDILSKAKSANISSVVSSLLKEFPIWSALYIEGFSWAIKSLVNEKTNKNNKL